ncbi:tRNA pseudouridine(55) synthase TruB [Bartonella tamiae]|uniref:tRNA pseudouridine synthase B n=1 Tax=Bartonella tamiae Th239 TaxID=1094558 RepID=J0ZRE3_9HYPH|nr:tRNA pseudouridine(55) synthase TruB [Bartonella tamiae]EJF91263.1 tRNA pseudouridine synthase B [Bartonella tamiae Th239]EJF93072.1 tRNA pseudouridine synthase B [Bartonella tamiae Th307]
MARPRKKKGRPISGWVILDKPKGMGSTEAVSKIKWLFQAEKAGHAGTLDPLASGLLPIALGEATKTVPYVMEGTKTYQFHVAWGEERDTDDLEGVAVKTSTKRPTQDAIKAILNDYIGVIKQIPPQYSAIKIDGNRAYDLAREGEKIEIPARKVEIDRLELMDVTNEGHAVFEVECGKGTYVRALARDMGRQLGCFGHISYLRRIEVAPFTEEDFVTLEILEDKAPLKFKPDEAESFQHPDFSLIDALLIDTGAALECLTQYALNDDQAHRVKRGNPIFLRGRDAPIAEDEVCVTQKGRLLAIGLIEKGQFKPKRVFTAV